MSIVAGVDFGTLSVRVSLFDSEKGRLGAGTAEYPLHRKKDDPDHATQSHRDHMEALVEATRRALASAGVDGAAVEALALDTTGSTVVAVNEALEPLDDYYLWCDHRAWEEAALITRVAHETGLEAIEWCGGVYSSEWGFAKLLHWLRHNPDKRARMATALEHCDMVAAVLCGIGGADAVPRSVCAMGHKWMWNRSLGGLPPEEFLTRVDPLLAGIRGKLDGRYATSDRIAGRLSPASCPPAMVDMERDVPGKTPENIWQKPIQRAWPRDICSTSVVPGSERELQASMIHMTMPPISRASAMTRRLSRFFPMVFASSHDGIAVTTKAMRVSEMGWVQIVRSPLSPLGKVRKN